ncbi:MAG: enoyl-CoA hydratase/isomerase family protein, partial [Gemmatimonadales bacterium]
VGPSRALELVWSARMVPAAEALSLGLVDRVVPTATILAEARALANVWAGFPPLAVRRAKELVYQSARASLAEMLDAEIAMQQELFATPEARTRLGASLATRSR